MPTIDLQTLKSRIDLAELFSSRGLKLVRRGANLVTLCPFHSDSRPSLVINPNRQLWLCGAPHNQSYAEYSIMRS
ncbi:MAG: hypothetical protein HY303_20415 [Candidatus Wallbacteria bacterium]|nr:hypothetical protein [Candidatus Wallbacteria bacterium]